MARLGVLGGAFDPPHIGHLIVAERAREEFGLKKIIFVPTNLPPHKPPPVASASDRLELIKMAVANNPYFEVSDIEIKRDSTSYTIDTIKELKKIYPSSEMFLLIGMDEAVNFMNWKEPDEILNLASFIIITRPGQPGIVPPLLEGRANFISLTLNISSTEIRALTKEGKSIKYLVPEKVEAYIKEKGLFSPQRRRERKEKRTE